MATLSDQTETNLLNGDTVAGNAAITPASVMSNTSTAFLRVGTPTAAGLGVIAPLEDTPASGDLPGYDPSISAEGGLFNEPSFYGGLGSDQLTGLDGDPGNFDNSGSSWTYGSAINETNNLGEGQVQYQVATLLNAGDIDDAVNLAVQEDQDTQNVIDVDVPSRGGNVSTGFQEISNSAGINISLGIGQLALGAAQTYAGTGAVKAQGLISIAQGSKNLSMGLSTVNQPISANEKAALNAILQTLIGLPSILVQAASVGQYTARLSGPAEQSYITMGGTLNYLKDAYSISTHSIVPLDHPIQAT